jgi:hypothetical protein
VSAKSEYLQIRVTPAQKAALRRLAVQAGQDVSTYVLARALPSAKLRFREIVDALARETSDGSSERSYLFAELNDLLTGLPSAAFAEAVGDADPSALVPFVANYVAALVEQAADRKRVAPPAWTRRVEPLDDPWFAGDLKSLRTWLLLSSPVPFRRRNLFVDAAIGDRV